MADQQLDVGVDRGNLLSAANLPQRPPINEIARDISEDPQGFINGLQVIDPLQVADMLGGHMYGQYERENAGSLVS